MKDDVKLLTAEEEAELGRRIRAWKDRGIDPEGGLAARNELVVRNGRLVGWQLGRMSCVRRREIDQHVPTGYSALLRAADNFDPARGRFSAYAVRWIRQFVRRAIQADNAIAVPLHVLDEPAKYPHLVPYAEAARVHLVGGSDALDHPIEDATAGDAAELASMLISSVRLDPKDRDIIVRYFGLEGPPESVKEIGESYGDTPSAIRQRKERAIRVLSVAARGRLRESFHAAGYLRAI